VIDDFSETPAEELYQCDVHADEEFVIVECDDQQRIYPFDAMMQGASAQGVSSSGRINDVQNLVNADSSDGPMLYLEDLDKSIYHDYIQNGQVQEEIVATWTGSETPSHFMVFSDSVVTDNSPISELSVTIAFVLGETELVMLRREAGSSLNVGRGNVFFSENLV
jgi:hypothetical protein